MAATLALVVLKHQKKENGTYNIKVRLTHERKSVYISTPYFVDKGDLDKDYKLGKKKMNELKGYVGDYQKIINNMGDDIYSYTAKTLSERLIRDVRPSSENINFISFMKRHYEEMKQEGRTSYENYRAAYNHLVSFAGEYLDFKEITSKLLYDFEKHLIQNSVGNRGVSLYMTCIRSTFNEGRNKYNDYDLDSIKISNYPFAKYKISATPQPKEKAAGYEVVLSVIGYEPQNETEQLAKDMFLLSFYMVGMNAKDIISCKSKVKDNRLTYNRSKTKDQRTDNAEISINIEPEIKYIFDKYVDKDKKRTFNIYTRFATPKNFNMSLSDGLKAIRECLNIDNMTFYSARHSWATIASHNCNIIDSHIAKCLNHVSMEHKITNKYIKRDWSLIDKCNRQVIDFINEKIKEKSEPG